MTARRLVYAGAFPDVGRFRVTWSSDHQEYRVQFLSPLGDLLAEYFTADRDDAIGTADRMLANRAVAVGAD